ncbi:AAA family ATPase [Shinella sp.]|uniref:AAA family ATPase n=1 Tax=Shinella sp. TaxID=1870904 RepID=UPI0025886390|nr:AAA family ATPase [Shinella sp.]MCW5711575.1 AAA family ATPase [Shinella sp.]
MAIKPQTITPTFESELTRLHVQTFFENLGPDPKGIHLLVIPYGTSTSAWYRAVEHQIQEIRSRIAAVPVESDPVDQLIIPGDYDDVDDLPEWMHSDFSVHLLSSAGLDDRTHARSCVIFVSEDDKEMLDNPSLLLLESTHRMKFDVHLAIQAAATCGREITVKEAFILTRMPARRRTVAFRSARSIRESWVLHCKACQIEARKQKEKEEEEEREAAKKRPKAKDERVVPDNTPYLQEMHGFGPAADWGRELAQDVEDWRRGYIGWSDVDNAVLLSGPPGCGKTTFAAALAKTLDAHLVVGSYSAWLGTGDGHQGDLISAMRRAFDEARKHAPSVLLIDEIDNFVQRGSLGNRRADEWMRGVTNSLLECLDGAVEREGVIVVGATNDPSGIDTAVRRSGRLDRHIEIPLPDGKARAAILRQHLGVFALDLAELERETEGMSGADLERVARDARRRARRERDELQLHHVRSALPVRQRHTPDQLRHIAVHECGHAVVAAAIGCTVSEVYIEPDFVPGSGAYIGGAAIIERPPGVVRDLAWYMDRVTHAMGGMVAEQMVYGAHSDGVAVDLAVATDLALQAAAGLGMGASLYSHGIPGMTDLSRAPNFDPSLRRRVDELLHEQATRARAVLEENREAFTELVELLIERQHLDGAVVQEIVRRPRRQLTRAV